MNQNLYLPDVIFTENIYDMTNLENLFL